MSIYEMMDYDDLQRRIGLEPAADGNWSWHCGNNPQAEVVLDEPGVMFDDPEIAYAGRNPKLVGGFCLSEDINVNGLLLNHRDDNNTLWLCTGIEGWWTLPPSEIPEVPKPYWDGALLTTGRYQTRIITITGLFLPPHPSLVWYNRDAILRASGIVRGVGLLAMCGNESPDLSQISDPTDPFLDPPKMAIIQTSDVPLIETVKESGLTQFSLSFRCVNPAKISVYEKNESLPIEIESTKTTRERKYQALSLGVGAGGGETTEYRELLEIQDSAELRHYTDVKKVNLDYPIEDEEFYTAGEFSSASYATSTSAKTKVLYNAGNYFAFPTFVFGQIIGASKDKPVTVRNLTTGESMQILKPVDAGHELVVDTNLRRVGEVDPDASVPSWKFDDRNYLSLTSEWLSLAPGQNTLIVTTPSTITMPVLPKIYYRDTWIG